MANRHWRYNLAITPIVLVRAPLMYGLYAIQFLCAALGYACERLENLVARKLPGWRR